MSDICLGTADAEDVAGADVRRATPVPWPRAIGFASVNMPIAGLVIPIGTFLPAHYTNYVGIDVATVGLVFLLALLLEAVSEPLVGMMVDATRTPFGQARPWLIGATSVAFIGSFAAFEAPRGVGAAYLFVALFLLYGGMSTSTIAQNTWAGRLAVENKERVKIFGWLHLCGQIGTLVVMASATAFGYVYSQTDGGLVAVMGAIFTCLIPATALIAVLSVGEPQIEERGPFVEKVHLTDPIRVLKSRSVIAILLSCFFIALGATAGGAAALFYWQIARGFTLVDVSIFGICYFVGSVISVPLWAAILRKVDKHVALICSSLAYMCINPLVFGLGGMHFTLAISGMFLFGLATGATQFIARAMMADANDEFDLIHGVDRLGQLNSMIGFFEKIGAALGIFAAFTLLGHVGFEGHLGSRNPPAAIWWVEQLTMFIPAGIVACSALALVGYRLTGARHRMIVDGLEEREAGKPRQCDFCSDDRFQTPCQEKGNVHERRYL